MSLNVTESRRNSLRVLYIDSAGPFGGAGRSLYESVTGLVARHCVQAFFLATDGTIVPYYSRVATDIMTVRGMPKFDNTWRGRYRGVRWLILLREILLVPIFVFGAVRARVRFGAMDIVHANEILEIAPLLFAKFLFGGKAVLHVRSLQSQEHLSFRNRLTYFFIKRFVDAVIAIDEGVKRTLPRGVKCYVVNNAFSETDDSLPKDHALCGKLAEIPEASVRIGFVGNLYRSKGIIESIKAIDMLRNLGVDAVFLVLGGATRRTAGLFSQAIRRLGLEDNVDDVVTSMIQELRLESKVVMLGSSDDIGQFYRSIDLLCFATWLDAPGRPVFEAAFFSRPSLVSVRLPTPDTLIHGVTGIAIDRPDPSLICNAIKELSSDRERMLRMGAAARELALKNNCPTINAARIYEIYRRLCAEQRETDSVGVRGF